MQEENNGNSFKSYTSIQVGILGEDIGSEILSSVIVSGDPEYRDHCDLFNEEYNLRTEVKMCSGNNKVRISPAKVERLFEVVDRSFVPTCGAFACIHWEGYRRYATAPNKKIFTLSNKGIDAASLRVEVAKDLRSIFIVDAKVVYYVSQNIPRMIKKGALPPDKDRNDREKSLVLNRTFFNDFRHLVPSQMDILHASVGHKGVVKSASARIKFIGEENFEKELPVWIIGQREMVEAIHYLLRMKDQYTVNLGKSLNGIT